MVTPQNQHLVPSNMSNRGNSFPAPKSVGHPFSPAPSNHSMASEDIKEESKRPKKEKGEGKKREPRLRIGF